MRLRLFCHSRTGIGQNYAGNELEEEQSGEDMFILGMAMVYIVFSIGLGCSIFVKGDMS